MRPAERFGNPEPIATGIARRPSRFVHHDPPTRPSPLAEAIRAAPGTPPERVFRLPTTT
jgi:hypothetical protein